MCAVPIRRPCGHRRGACVRLAQEHATRSRMKLERNGIELERGPAGVRLLPKALRTPRPTKARNS